MRRPLATALAVAFVLSSAPAVSASDHFVTSYGYIRMKDGVLLRYGLVRPSVHGRFPVVMRYGPYESGETPLARHAFFTDLLHEGVAIIGVNVRGTTCSGGPIELIDPNVGLDGAAVVEWIARQSWSNQRVAMSGYSFEGIDQLFVAAQHPRHLVAIAPGQVVSDFYRDVAFPGGLLNRGYTLNYPPEQVYISYLTMGKEVARGDTRCAMNATQRDPGPTAELVSKVVGASYTDQGDGVWRSIEADTVVPRIRVPILLTRTWQDNQTGGRISYLPKTFGSRNVWSIFGNGDHDNFYADVPFVIDALEHFLLYYLKDEPNHWPLTPRVQILHELDDAGRPAWVTTSDTWPPHARPLSLYLNDTGGLQTHKPTRASSTGSSYLYPTLSPSAPDSDQFEIYGMAVNAKDPVPGAGWNIPVTPDGFVAFTTPPLARDAEILGTGNADLWLTSTASDTDLQVTLSEVRPDGQEVYLQRGWLRASHRAEDPKRSTVLRPFQTHRKADAHNLVPGEPAHMRVEFFPVGHVFRKGSSIRLIVDAPTGLTGDWELNFLNTPAINTVLHDAAHPSRLVLPLVDGSAYASMPACGVVKYEPCRTSIAPVPRGLLTP